MEDKIEITQFKKSLEILTNKALDTYREFGDKSHVSRKFLTHYEDFMDTLMKTAQKYGINHNTKYRIMKFLKKIP